MKLLLIAIVALLAIGASITLYAEPAQCVFCGNMFCMSSANCPNDCTCIRPRGSVSGECM